MRPIALLMLSLGFRLLAAAPAEAGEYGWTISASSADPFVNTAAATLGDTSH